LPSPAGLGRLALVNFEHRPPNGYRRVHGEVADLTVVVAGLALEFSYTENVLAASAARFERALGEHPFAVLLQGEARDAEAAHQLRVGRHRHRSDQLREGQRHGRVLATPPWSAMRVPTGRLPTTRLR